MRSVQFRLAALLLAPHLLFVHAPARATQFPSQPAEPSPKIMFYNPAGAETAAQARLLPDSARRLREVNYLFPLRHCGIHYWLEDSKGVAFTAVTASRGDGSYSVYVRASCNGFLTVFDVTKEGQ